MPALHEKLVNRADDPRKIFFGLCPIAHCSGRAGNEVCYLLLLLVARY